MKRLLLIAAAAALLAACKGGGATPDPAPVDPDPVEDKTPGTSVFYKGTTMCFASYVQDLGLKYRENGKETDPYQSVKNHGANCVRLQLDQISFSSYGGATIDWQSWNRVLADARKAKALGLQIFLTLKPDYDIYTDAATHHNIMPPSWTGKTPAQAGEAVGKWCAERLDALAAEGIYPAIVAIGNEVNVGFCRTGQSEAANNTRTGQILAAAIPAVRDYATRNNPACLIAIHIANPSKVESSIKSYESAGALDYDVVAISYYPGKDIGHSMPYNSFAALAKAMKKKIMVVETAYSFTTGSLDGKWMGDWCGNAYNYPDWNDATNAANYTPAKQRAWLSALAADIKAGGGLGLITWGTESLPDLLEGKEAGHGLGLYTYPAAWAYGSTWENNSYWDFTHSNNLHEGIDWMSDIN